jgi:uncharacterized membrane protein
MGDLMTDLTLDARPSTAMHAIWRRRTLTTLAAWAVAAAVGGSLDLFAAIPLPLIAGFVALGIAGPLALYFGNRGFRAFMHALPIEALTTFHVWRVPAALLFFWYGSQGLLPETFVRHAAWGDLVAGLLVPIVLIPPKSRSKFLGFHLFGLADFVLAVGTGLVFSLRSDPVMATIATMPLVMIPLFGVCVSGVSHVIAMDRLLAERRATRATASPA